jgi:hypothetical protein
MRSPWFHLRALPALVVVSAAVALTTPALTGWEQDEKTIYLSALDAKGNTVTDLTTADVMVREDAQDREVVSVKVSTQPMHIVLLADTTKEAGDTGMMSRQDTTAGAAEFIRDIRTALTTFSRDILKASPQSQIEVMEFGQAAVPISKLTSNLADVEKGITRLFPKPNADSVLLEAIVEASKTLGKAKAARPLIMVLNIEPSNEQSRQEPQKMLEELEKSRASLWAVSLQKSQATNERRGVVLSALTTRTGGRRESIVGQAALETLFKQFAANMREQYEVTYRRPAGTNAKVVQVGVKRDGLKVYSNFFAPK